MLMLLKMLVEMLLAEEGRWFGAASDARLFQSCISPWRSPILIFRPT